MLHANNFNLIRVVAAAAVIVSHSYTFTSQPFEPLEQALGYSLGTLAVKVFFAISGYLIYKSWLRSTLNTFLIARAARLFPGLLVVCLILTLVVGPALSIDAAYAVNARTWIYTPATLLLLPQGLSLPGLFTDSPFPVTNGSLWTLHYEAACYIAVALLGLTGAFRRLPLLLAGFAAIHFATPSLYTDFGLPFAVGLAIAHYGHVPRASVTTALIAASIAAYWLGAGGVTVSAIATSYATLMVGLKTTPILTNYNRLGDYSYGLYIYGWPVQQMLRPFIADDPIMLSVAALAAALPLAVVSWYLVESPALRWAKSNRSKPEPTDQTRLAVNT